MLYLIAKAVISGVIIVAASETAKRSPTYGSLILSLPLISILAFIWLWRDTGDNERIALLAEGTSGSSSDATIVPRPASPPKKRHGVLDRARDLLRDDYRALSGHGVAASEDRHRFLTLHLAALGQKADALHSITLCPLCPSKADIRSPGQHVR